MIGGNVQDVTGNVTAPILWVWTLLCQSDNDPPMPVKHRATVSLVIPRELLEELDAARVVSRSSVICQAIREWLDNRKDQPS